MVELERYRDRPDLARIRLAIVVDLISAIERRDEILRALDKVENRSDALSVLMAVPFHYSLPSAQHILNLRLDQITSSERARLTREASAIESVLDS